MATIRILTQYAENYSDNLDNPHWKNKGGNTFVVDNLEADILIYCNNLKDALKALVTRKSNDHFKYTYVSHEILFQKDDYSITTEDTTAEILAQNKNDE